VARHRWPDLNAVVVVESRRELNGKITDETRFYITSLVMPAAAVGPMIRARWAIENPLHWVMDMVFRDDECPVRTDNARPISQPPAQRSQSHPQAPGKDFIGLRRKTARSERRVSRQPHRRQDHMHDR
jgi:hypothetical protein